ncbi:Nuclear pore complex protein [Cardamine amara subsp. amara]|uniref:Nuclear pore complex protein n=1 Tax=Cardamine amara subsp. amara TaxID=228776 RepID=A0ABD1BKX4_CARAN
MRPLLTIADLWRSHQRLARLFRPEELIEIYLSIQGRWTAIKAFEMFAYTSFSFRENNRSLLEECWRNVADQDDWDRLHQASANEG